MNMSGEPALRLEDTPRVRRPFRLQYEQAQSAWVLLYPEGMVKLSGSAGEIMKRIDGKTTLDALIRDLEAVFPGAALRQDVLEFVETAHARGWISAAP
jgi:pyrroloquinoline quinone biosynthesis protein D